MNYPKYKVGDPVRFFSIDENHMPKVCMGVVAIVDPYGTFEQNEEPSYDIRVLEGSAPCLYKHIRESKVRDI